MKPADDRRPFDVVVIGGGILGTSIAYWLSTLYHGERIAVIEKERAVAQHTSGRNTGVIHRPFYLDPGARRRAARAAQAAYSLWKSFALKKQLPWREVGTIEVALDEGQLAALERYRGWAAANGMEAREVELLTADQVKKLEPRVRCAGALWCKTDTAVDFGSLTAHVAAEAQANGVQFVMVEDVRRIDERGDALVLRCASGRRISARFLINSGGGHAVDIAHGMGVAGGYTDLHFRGDYWVVDPAHAGLAARNIYTVPRHGEFPFLDPHWIVRWNGQVEIGPNAVPVSHPQLYRGIVGNPLTGLQKLAERPITNKLRLLGDPDFLFLALAEWRSALSRRAMVERVRRFLPELRPGWLIRRGVPGVRSSVIDGRGRFVGDALEIEGPKSLHVLNYNSPGATGAPAFAASVVRRLIAGGRLDHAKRRDRPDGRIWDYERVTALLQS